MLDLKGKRVLVTGGAQGIGKGLARSCLKRGATVVICNLDEQVAADTVAELSEIGPIRSLRSDVSVRSEVDALLDDMEAHEGLPELLFCNAGFGGASPILSMPMADVQSLFEVNFYSMIHLTQSYVPRVKTGHIMYTGSENSLVAPPYLKDMHMGMYGATKHAMLVLAEWLRSELDGSGVSVSVLMPGPVLTERLAANIDRFPETLKELFMTTDACAEVALEGLEKGLFYIPTQSHIRRDVEQRYREIMAAFDQLGL
ncbi:MAG: SDR family oxidoreductase [Gammaproteobacteria bacterium]|nr:SDR family oxidoreductase [Gammaproteobacteria bacterium]